MLFRSDPGNDLVVQLHLKPTGREESVQVSVGFYFTDRPPATTPIMLRLGSKTIDIPADSRDYEVIDRFTLPVDVQALGIYPHAHYLGKEMLVLARRPALRGVAREVHDGVRRGQREERGDDGGAVDVRVGLLDVVAGVGAGLGRVAQHPQRLRLDGQIGRAHV